MGLVYRKSKTVAEGTRANFSGSGVSVSKRVGPLTLNSRGTGALRIAPGFSYRFGKRGNPLWALAPIVVVGVVMTALWLVVATFRVGWWLLRWPVFTAAALAAGAVRLVRRWRAAP